MAEGHSDDADALANFALCCVQLRSDHKQNIKPINASPLLPTPRINSEKKGEKDKVNFDIGEGSGKNSISSSSKSSFGRFFGLGVKEKHDNSPKIVEITPDKINEKQHEHENLYQNEKIKSDTGFSMNQSTVVAMHTPDPGSLPIFSAGGPNESQRISEILDYIEVMKIQK